MIWVVYNTCGVEWLRRKAGCSNGWCFFMGDCSSFSVHRYENGSPCRPLDPCRSEMYYLVYKGDRHLRLIVTTSARVVISRHKTNPLAHSARPWVCGISRQAVQMADQHVMSLP